METALLAAFEPCMALPHMQEFDAVKKNNAAGGFITDEQADTIFLLSSLQLIVHAFGMVGGKKMAETATNSAMWEKPDVHGGLAAHEAKIRPFFDTLSQMNFADADSCLQHFTLLTSTTLFASPLAPRACPLKCVTYTTKWRTKFALMV